MNKNRLSASIKNANILSNRVKILTFGIVFLLRSSAQQYYFNGFNNNHQIKNKRHIVNMVNMITSLLLIVFSVVFIISLI